MAIDARLKWLLEERAAPQGASRDAVEALAGAGADVLEWLGPRAVDLLVASTPGADPHRFETELRHTGFEVHTLEQIAGGWLATGEADIDAIAGIDASTTVARVEAPRDLKPELVTSLVECRAAAAHVLVPHALGQHGLVGVIDGGIDYRHMVFDGVPGAGTRIVALWDQSATAVAGGGVPYGRVYTKADIDAARVAGAAPLPHRDTGGHGTHVASCAAGADVRPGVACGADLLVVSLGSNGQSLGRSKHAIDAFDWIVREARRQQRPVAVNLSQGMNGGGHVGASLLELAMDEYSRQKGVAVVKSAGNEQQMRIHASGSMTVGSVVTFDVVCQQGKRSPGQLELWLDERDDVEVRVEPPSGPPTAWFNLANLPQTPAVAGQNLLRLDVDVNPERTGDNLVTVFFGAGGSAIGLVPGTWRVHARALRVGGSGLVHAWLERTTRTPAAEQLRFSTASSDPTCTISVPGTARRVITVGSYVTTPSPPGSALIGALSDFGGRGPTRSGVQKPDLIAPGEWVDAARSSASAGSGAWASMRGTSMAAPHVTGAAAILLAEDPTLSGEEIRQILVRTARPLPSSPDSLVGHGRLDVSAAVALVRAGGIPFPKVVSATLVGTTFTIVTAAACTASLLYDASSGRMSVGLRAGGLASTSLSPAHTFQLAPLGAGTWHFELQLFDAGWRTIADNGGAPWSVVVP
jgi:subtilisin family serine protease